MQILTVIWAVFSDYRRDHFWWVVAALNCCRFCHCGIAFMVSAALQVKPDWHRKAWFKIFQRMKLWKRRRFKKDLFLLSVTTSPSALWKNESLQLERWSKNFLRIKLIFWYQVPLELQQHQLQRPWKRNGLQTGHGTSWNMTPDNVAFLIAWSYVYRHCNIATSALLLLFQPRMNRFHDWKCK